MRLRTIFTAGGSIAILALLLILDPDSGLGIKLFSPSTMVLVLKILSGIMLVSCAFWAKKALMDYPEADMRTLFKQALAGNVSAGLALIAHAIIFCALIYVFSSSAHAQPLPPNAVTYAPILKAEQVRFWSDHPKPSLLGGLVEQESCISLKSSKCWSPASQLKTSREEGAGLGQITRAYRADGALRFDSLATMRTQYSALSEWSWANVYQRPDLQLRAIVLMSRENFQALGVVENVEARLAMADAAYNGGLGGVKNERRACGLKAGCDAQQWFGNVENTCLKSRTALYGQRSACDINRQHVQAVMRERSAKYAKVMA